MAMQKVSVDQILKYVEKLSVEEKEELTTKIIPFSKKEFEEDKAMKILIKKGILKEADVGTGYMTGSFKAIKIKGEPMSETVIKNRG